MDTEQFEDIELEIFNDNECPICYERLVNYIKLECKHNFCLTCHSGFIKNNHIKCPICRTVIKGMDDNINLYKTMNDNNQILIRANTSLEWENRIISTRYLILEKKYGIVVVVLLLIMFGFIMFCSSLVHIKLTPVKPTEPEDTNKDIKEIMRIQYYYLYD